MTEQEKEKAAFFEQYASAADEKVLEDIWQAKQSEATYLYLNAEESLKDLSPLKDLTALQQLGVYNTQVSDLTFLKELSALQRLDV
ncbi:MAG: hypothetical protein JNL70_23450 [Saprospiraceae bacterium]|nr:hypothetical protein [Saprospiraceae bacterium]